MPSTMRPMVTFSSAKAVALAFTLVTVTQARYPTGSPGNHAMATHPLSPPNAPANPLETYQVSNAVENVDGRVYLLVNSTKLEQRAQWVTVSWSGILFPSYDDFIALYPDGADVKSTSPIKFKMASSSPSHMTLGVGTAQ